MPRIELKHITKKWGDFTAVEDLNLIIDDQGFVILLGPSGCGKTTTLRMIAGLETPTEGQISIDGKVVFDSESGINIPPAKRDIGFLFQNYALWPHMTVRQNISFGLENLKWPKEKIEKRVTEMLELLHISEFIDRYPSEISGGQQQRVAIARTLAPEPKVLFMDEPLSNLDAKLRNEMRTELKRLHSSMKSTFIYVTHDQLEAMTLGTKVCLMKDGIVQQYDSPLETYSSPNNLFVADFIGNPTMNFVSANAKQVNATDIELSLFDSKYLLKLNKEEKLEVSDVMLGIRPEFIKLNEGVLQGNIYSALPTGMETTVRLEIDGEYLSAVVFGAVDFKADEKIYFDFTGNGIVLFDKHSGNRIGIGRLIKKH